MTPIRSGGDSKASTVVGKAIKLKTLETTRREGGLWIVDVQLH